MDEWFWFAAFILVIIGGIMGTEKQITEWD
jgi:hypothetical protein